MEATSRDLRLHTAEVLAAADRGERVVITYRGRSRAVITRWSESDLAAGAARNPAFGLWRDQDEAVEAEVRRLRQRRELP